MFDLPTSVMVVVACLIVFFTLLFMTRKLALRPTGKPQIRVEAMVNFVKGMISSNMAWKQGGEFDFMAITLIAFIFVANIIGIPFTIILPDADHTLWWKSPTADPTVTLTLAGLMIVMT